MRKQIRYLILFFSVFFIPPIFAACNGHENGVDDSDSRNGGGDSNEKVFKAGAAIVNVNGTIPSGRSVHDNLHARVLVLDDGTSKLVFVVVDEQTVSREVFDEAKKQIMINNKIPSHNILMSATHTHSSTTRAAGSGTTSRGYNVRYSWNANKALDEYQTFLVGKIAEAVNLAIKGMEPAKIGFGIGSVPQWVFNRRWMMKEPVINPYGGYDKVLFNPGVANTNKLEPVGPVDPEVSFISVQALDGRPISILANYSTHYAGGVNDNDISADYFGLFSGSMAKLLGATDQSRPFIGIMSNGSSGDINATDYGVSSSPSYKPYEKMQKVADDIAEEVYRVYQKTEHHDWLALKTAQTELSLQVRRANKEVLEHVQKVLSRPVDEPLRHPRELIQARYVMQLYQEWPESIKVPLQVISIGDLAIAAIPFEVFAETGLELKDKSPFGTTFTIGLANGWYGYLPTPEQHELGGWETWMGGSNKVQEDASELIVERVLEMFDEIKK